MKDSRGVVEAVHVLDERYVDVIEAVRRLDVAGRHLRAAQKDADRAIR